MASESSSRRRGHAHRPERNLQYIGMNHDAVDQQVYDADCSAEITRPTIFNFFSASMITCSLNCLAARSAPPIPAEEAAHLIDHNVIDHVRRDGFQGAFAVAGFDRACADVIAIGFVILV